MKRIAWLIGALVAVGGTAAPQDEQPSIRKENRCCNKQGTPLPWDGYNNGVKWAESMDKAYDQARKEKKLLMVFTLVGDLDKGGC